MPSKCLWTVWGRHDIGSVSADVRARSSRSTGSCTAMDAAAPNLASGGMIALWDMLPCSGDTEAQ